MLYLIDSTVIGMKIYEPTANDGSNRCTGQGSSVEGRVSTLRP